MDGKGPQPPPHTYPIPSPAQGPKAPGGSGEEAIVAGPEGMDAIGAPPPSLAAVLPLHTREGGPIAPGKGENGR